MVSVHDCVAAVEAVYDSDVTWTMRSIWAEASHCDTAADGAVRRVLDMGVDMTRAARSLPEQYGNALRSLDEACAQCGYVEHNAQLAECHHHCNVLEDTLRATCAALKRTDDPPSVRVWVLAESILKALETQTRLVCAFQRVTMGLRTHRARRAPM